MICRNNEQVTSTVLGLRDGMGNAHLTKLIPEMPAHLKLFNIITLEPQASIGYHMHEHETELFYFVSGRALLRDDGVEYELTAGDAAATGHGHWHGVKNIGDEPLVMVACIVTEK